MPKRKNPQIRQSEAFHGGGKTILCITTEPILLEKGMLLKRGCIFEAWTCESSISRICLLSGFVNELGVYPVYDAAWIADLKDKFIVLDVDLSAREVNQIRDIPFFIEEPKVTVV